MAHPAHGATPPSSSSSFRCSRSTLVAAGIFVSHARRARGLHHVGGLLLGVMNTVLTEAVMEATDLPARWHPPRTPPSASSAARPLPRSRPALWHGFGATVPYLFAAVSVLVAALAVLLGRRVLARIDGREADVAEEGAAVLIGDAA